MTWRLFHELDSFLEPCNELLGADPARHTLPLSLVEQLQAGLGWSDEPPVFGLREEQGVTTGIVLMTPPHNLVIGAMPAGSAGALVERLVAGDFGLPGVYGTPEATDEFVGAWTAASGAAVATAGDRRLYVLGTLLPPEPAPAGRSRRAGLDDLDLVAAWFGEFVLESEGHPPLGDPDHARARERARVEAGLFWLWEEPSGVPVSMAGSQPPAAGVARVGPVYTPPAFRRHGYGTAVTAACSAGALAAGAGHVVLFTDLANPTSNAIYQQIGYRPVCDYREVRFASSGT